MINFSRAFDSAWERMMIILFRPFDLGKWFVIGFSAFLAGLLNGGNGVNGSFNNFNDFNPNQKTSSQLDLQQFNSELKHAFVGWQLGMMIGIFLVAFVFVLALVFLFYWLGARGQFLFLDNIVRNRAAVAWPWRQYARQGNSLFLTYVLFFVVSLTILLPIIVVAIVMCIPLFQQQRWPHGWEIGGFVVLGILYIGIALLFGFVIFVFREFGVPLMFRNGLMGRAAFMESMRLLKLHPGSVVVFALLRFAIAIGVGVLSILACCFTCCLAAIPYLGTVIILPVLIYVRCFTLECLAQFGPQYDVWTVDVPQPGVSLQRPPG